MAMTIEHHKIDLGIPLANKIILRDPHSPGQIFCIDPFMKNNIVTNSEVIYVSGVVQAIKFNMIYFMICCLIKRLIYAKFDTTN